jgi:hypothetical protein
MHVVLTCWQCGKFKTAPDPPRTRTAVTLEGEMPRDEWNTFFQSLATVFWYHEYVYEVIGEEKGDGFGKSVVQRTINKLSAQGGEALHGKLALLDILKLVYRSNYSSK